jgi:hypothetical protein
MNRRGEGLVVTARCCSRRPRSATGTHHTPLGPAVRSALVRHRHAERPTKLFPRAVRSDDWIHPAAWTVAFPRSHSSRSSTVITGIAGVGIAGAAWSASCAGCSRRRRARPAAGKMITDSSPAAINAAALAFVTTPICTPIWVHRGYVPAHSRPSLVCVGLAGAPNKGERPHRRLACRDERKQLRLFGVLRVENRRHDRIQLRQLVMPSADALPQLGIGPGADPHKPKSPKTQALCESGRQDLNLRPPGPQPGALPDCATPRASPRFYGAPGIHTIEPERTRGAAEPARAAPARWQSAGPYDWRRQCATGMGLLAAIKRATGIEPALGAWKAPVQPQHFARATELNVTGAGWHRHQAAPRRAPHPRRPSAQPGATRRPSCHARRRASRSSR